ncbi:MAG: crosslink repair DNA glycosylase YcaQ family protein [Tabrizicola sp.]|uniref:winged helix-turn-helix domain-containing protein n=1 Tax=Tabrizicola sp. TaxID=2005166 RepID=UPI002733C445|nr:crosslink repair DNA glycosylase YcaQ family protein [Tabrizicola sp.]MDP3262384.1 crosslink repair DNA glycosylase YcaQ family protein [Tabrizicola sp.]MDP3647869.1 crosslink repair DNA glycosylase YcaQ family protein [Paracoccaceae bacterium]MDZ4066127.1 crosslink repair DNA glycosylase YcaQ family protein [Tabrizicola sp.]
MALPLLSNRRARHLFLDRHALAEAPAGAATGQALHDLIQRIGFVQVDSINTVARAHDMILFARRQTYRPDALKRLLERDRSLWEHWTHDASILPAGLHGVWQHRFQRDAERLHMNWRKFFREGYEAQFDTILNRIARDGPVGTADVGEGEVRGKGGWWDWHPSKTALEWLWRTGQIAVTRRDGFRKIYDLTERVIPAPHRTPVPADIVVDWACTTALDRLGFATPGELAAYWNAISPEEAKAWAKAALASAEVIEVDVEGASGQPRRALIRPETLAATPPEPTARLRILSPFDPALRDRDRAEHLFGFRYRIEVFVPEPKRIYGYYVFPILEADRLIGRIDAKAFRDEGTLRVKAVWPEPGIRLGSTRRARLQTELDRLARFSGCERVEFLPGWEREPIVGAHR